MWPACDSLYLLSLIIRLQARDPSSFTVNSATTSLIDQNPFPTRHLGFISPRAKSSANRSLVGLARGPGAGPAADAEGAADDGRTKASRARQAVARASVRFMVRTSIRECGLVV